MSEGFFEMAESDFQLAAIIKLSQNEWVKFFWVNLREDNKVVRIQWVKFFLQRLNPREFKMAAIIKLSQNEWVKFFCANVGN